LVLLAAEHGEEGADSFGVLHGLYWVVVGLATETPLVLCVDDVQWADRPSLRFLVHLARRLEGTPAALLVGLRTGEPEATDELLEELRSAEGARIVRPAPLSEGAVLAVVRSELAAEADEKFCQACYQASGGNPFYLRELLRALAAESVSPTREEVERVRGVWPASIARHVLRRIARVGAGAPALAGAMAVLGDGTGLRAAATLAGVEDAGALARSLLEMEILAEEEPFRFVHPVVRGAVYADLTPDKREGLHLRAAQLLIEEGGEDDRVAAHLLAVSPADRAWCVEALRSAARGAIGRGAPESAVLYLRRALAERTTEGDERVDVLRELGVAEAHSADPAAVEHLEQAKALCADPRRRAVIALELAQALENRGLDVEAAEVIRSALTERKNLRDPELELRLEAALVSAAASDARGYAPDVIEVYGRLLVDVPDGEAGQIIQAFAAGAAAWAGAPADAAVELARQAFQRGLLHSEQWDAIGRCMWALILCERYEEVSGHLAELSRAVERRGHARGLALVAQLQANRAERLGSLAEAESNARLALEILEQGDIAVGSLSRILCSLVDVLVARGDLDEAESALSRMPAGDWPPHLGCMSTLAARGRLRLAQDRPDEALVDLLAAGRQYQEWPSFPLEGPAPSHWRSSAALVLQRLGNLDEARRLATEEVEAARAFGTPRATGIALRAAGTVACADDALPLLHESVAVLQRSPATLERARSSVALGSALRRRGQRVAARQPLRQGWEGARRCGATPLSAFAHDELIAAGARPRREAFSGIASLTASERRVADLAAQGLTNRQLAQTLYLSAKTVEMHLSRAYRKLDINSRGDLAGALAPAAPD
jgi:DNA-binding CsgD family transcriptional regulator